MPSLHHRTCHLCEAMCGVVIEHEGAKILSIRGDEADPFSRGHVCPKVVGIQDVHEDPDRLKRPLKRVGSGWEEISWETAFDEITTRLKQVQAQHGKDSVAVYQGNPTVHNVGSMTFGQLFVRSLRTKRRFSATSVDQLPHMLAALELFGHQLMMPVPDVDRTAYLLVLGANPMVSNGSLATAPDFSRRIKVLQERGGRMVVLDPRRTETAQKADQHLFIRPGTDVCFLLAFIHTLFRDGLVKLGHLESVVEGLEQLRAATQEFSPQWAESITGISSITLEKVVREFCAAPSAVCYGRMGASVQAFGGLCGYLLTMVNVLTGNLDREGGAMFSLPAVDVLTSTAQLKQQGHFNRYKSRVRGLPEFGGELPASCLAEEIDTPGEGQIRALVTSCGNPVLSLPNGNRLEAALPNLELMVSVDIYLNETTRHAHYILPPTFGVETEQYDLAFHALAIRNTARFSDPMIARAPEQRHDWEIFLELSSRLESSGPLGIGGAARRLAGRSLGPSAVIDLGLRSGPYGAGLNPFGKGLTLARLKKQPQGVDLGPLKPCLPGRLFHATGRIPALPEIYARDLARVKRQAATLNPSDGLVMISRRDLRSNNSWLHNSLRLVKGKNRCNLKMNPQDAAARGLKAGQEVTIRSRVGEVRAPLEVTEEMMPGVVCLPHGWGHGRQGVRIQVASAHPGVSINDLNDEQRVDALSGNAAFSGLPVEVLGSPGSQLAV